MSCGKLGLLHSRSRSRQWFKMSVNVCLDDIFWTTEHFVTKLGVIMQHHKPMCSVKKLDYCNQGQGHSKGSKCQCLSRWYLLKQHFVTKLGIVMHHYELHCHAKKVGLLVLRSRSQQGFIWSWQFLLYLLNCWSFCYQTWFDSTLS